MKDVFCFAGGMTFWLLCSVVSVKVFGVPSRDTMLVEGMVLGLFLVVSGRKTGGVS